MIRECKRSFQLNHLWFVAGNLPLEKTGLGSWPHIESNSIMERIQFNEIALVESFVGSQRDAEVFRVFPVRKRSLDQDLGRQFI
ncbi:hypothetical protein D3C77_460520 [compost metagenome]